MEIYGSKQLGDRSRHRPVRSWFRQRKWNLYGVFWYRYFTKRFPYRTTQSYYNCIDTNINNKSWYFIIKPINLVAYNKILWFINLVAYNKIIFESRGFVINNFTSSSWLNHMVSGVSRLSSRWWSDVWWRKISMCCSTSIVCWRWTGYSYLGLVATCWRINNNNNCWNLI